MWTVIEHPPQPFGECTICKKHDCGIYKDDEGQLRQLWAHFTLEMDVGGKLAIGYNCIKSMSEEMGVTKRIIEKPVYLTPTAEQIHDYIMRGMKSMESEQIQADPVQSMTRKEMNAWLKDRNIEFTPQWGDEKLRELVKQHA